MGNGGGEESSPDEPSLGRAAGAGGSTAAGAAASSLPPQVPQLPPDLPAVGATAAPMTPSDTEGHIHHSPAGTAPCCNEFAGALWSQNPICPPQVGLSHSVPGPRFGYGAGWARGPELVGQHLRREAPSILRADVAHGHVRGVGINPLQLPSALSAGCEQIPLKSVHLQEGTRQKPSFGRLEAIRTGSTMPDPQQPHGRSRQRGAGAGGRAGARQHPDPPSSKPGSPHGAREDAKCLQSHLGAASCSRKAGFPPER